MHIFSVPRIIISILGATALVAFGGFTDWHVTAAFAIGIVVGTGLAVYRE